MVAAAERRGAEVHARFGYRDLDGTPQVGDPVRLRPGETVRLSHQSEALGECFGDRVRDPLDLLIAIDGEVAIVTTLRPTIDEFGTPLATLEADITVDEA